MEMSKFNLHGLYLVVDPSVERLRLLEKVEQALQGGVDILQIWNHWSTDTPRADKERLIRSIYNLTVDFDAPILINDDWDLLKTTPLQGVHFDAVPDDFNRIKREMGRSFITGITCSNNLETVQWAEQNGLDYVSFCAMYPSPSVGSCEIVHPETVQKARKLTDLPLFLSGGMTPGKISKLDEMNFNGVAVISGILNADDAWNSAKNYKKALKKHD
jgi:thiamine-phosphate pyrophosphorylase